MNMKLKPGETPAAGAPAATPPAPAAEKPTKELRKRRPDFENWADWCEYMKQNCLTRAAKLNTRAEAWEKQKAGEHLAKAEKKIKRIEAMTKKVEALKAELAAQGIKVDA